MENPYDAAHYRRFGWRDTTGPQAERSQAESVRRRSVVLHPELTLEQAEEKWRDKNSKRWLGQNLDKSIVKYRPEVSTFYRTPDWHAKLLLLRGVLDADFYAKAYERVRQIKYTPAANSKRAALKGSPGGEALFGFNDQMQVIAHLRLRQKD